MSNFGEYSAYYDLLYADKDYAAEAKYVARKIRQASPTASSILELGSGTGRHGRLLAELDFDVQGVELSPEMVAFGAKADPPRRGRFSCRIGDIRHVALGQTFDVVIALFHVVGYQVRNEDLLATFQTASNHLKPGGIFIFDVWHGPAVLTQRPEKRTKAAGDERHRVVRHAIPELDTNAGTVCVTYNLDCEDLRSGKSSLVTEKHLMRYLFPTEVDWLASNANLSRIFSEEFFTARPLSEDTWGACYGLRKQLDDDRVRSSSPSL